jgi:Putative prokaryotic signal transducing protein
MMQSKPNWQKVFTTRFYTEAEIVRGKLEENEIPVQLLNKQDTMYNVALGEIEVYVPAVLKEMALALLSQSLEN